jgi:cytochrome c oxidase subunit 2
VPDLGWKRDAVPGFINEAWTEVSETGVYRGQCAELCGKDHGFMPIVVEAVSRAEFDQWVQSQRDEIASEQQAAERLWSRSELMQHGREVYATQCASCHQSDGEGLAPAFPALAGSQVATGPLEEHIRVVLDGVGGTAMPAWGEMLSVTDIAAALTYTRNAFGNDTGDLVQPRTIERIKNG